MAAATAAAPLPFLSSSLISTRRAPLHLRSSTGSSGSITSRADDNDIRGSSTADGQSGGGAGDGRTRRWAKLSARRRETISLVAACDSAAETNPDPSLSIVQFLRHRAGVESLLNAKTLQSFTLLPQSPPHTYLCTLREIRFMNYRVIPVMELRVSTADDNSCNVEMLSCRFEGSEGIDRQSNLFSAFMKNRLTWEASDFPLLVDIDAELEVRLEVYSRPFSLLPLSAVEKPGNLLMQGLLDRLVPLLAEQLLRDYLAWVDEQAGNPS